MAKIILSDEAPSDAKSFSLANANFDVPYETNDTVIVANALAHPWLTVERDESAAESTFREPSVRPEDDALSATNSIANDPEAVARFNAEQEAAAGTPLAVDAGLDQNKAETVGEGDTKVAVTLAADDDATAPPRSRFTPTDKDN
jgi:hypothetical protein